ncbi:MAG: site-specific integrase [candidate division Zixibacteria bacterium]|nr:site-specific integrase [candidate division Zixibacteria bacterium]
MRAEADSIMDLLLNLALYAGLRRSELYYLRWQDIDLKLKLIHIRAHGKFVPKNKKPGTVPINNKLFKILKKAYPKGKISDDKKYIFGEFHKSEWANPTIPLSKKFTLLSKKAGVKNAGLHVCRHTFASHLVQAGEPLLVVKELMRHSDIKSTMVYAHLAPDQPRKAVESLGY